MFSLEIRFIKKIWLKLGAKVSTGFAHCHVQVLFNPLADCSNNSVFFAHLTLFHMKTLLRGIFLCWLIAIPFAARSQYIPNADSLLRRLPQLKGPEHVAALLDLCIAYLGKDKDKTIRYASQALEESERLNADSLIFRSLNYQSIAYLNHGELQLAIQAAQREAELARKQNKPRQLLDAMSNLSGAYIRSSKNEQALQTALEGLSLAEQEKDDKSMVNFYEVIAAVQKVLKQWTAAEETYRKELVVVERLGRPFEAARAYNNFGLLYAERSRHKEAVGMFEKSRDRFNAMGYASGAAVAQLNLADALLGSENYPKAKAAYLDVLERNKAIQDPEMESLATTSLGVIALSTKDFAAAQSLFSKAEKTAQEAGLIDVLRNIYAYLENLAVAKGDFHAAWAYKERSKLYADSAANQNITNRITELQVQYDTQKKETEIAQQRAQLLAQESALFRQRAWLAGLLIGALVLAALALLFHNRFRLRQKALLDAAIIREQKLGLNAVIEGQEAERRRIAKDLHDGIAQELVALKLGFTALQRKVETAVPAEANRLDELTRQLDASCTEVRNLAHVMLPPTLEQHGLAPSLELLLRNTVQQAGLQVEFDPGSLPARMDEKVEIGVYRIAQELLNNILKHARAARVLLQVYTAGNNLVLRLEDDGIGFDFESAKQKGSMGILNILSRAGTLGGTFFAEPRQPSGTVATVRVPLPA